MTDFTKYEKGCSPCEIQRKYGLTYVQGYELAERLKKTQELELEERKENAKLKKQLAIAVEALETTITEGPCCQFDDDCPLNNGEGFDNGCATCSVILATDALKQIKELDK